MTGKVKLKALFLFLFSHNVRFTQSRFCVINFFGNKILLSFNQNFNNIF